LLCGYRRDLIRSAKNLGKHLVAQVKWRHSLEYARDHAIHELRLIPPLKVHGHAACFVDRIVFIPIAQDQSHRQFNILRPSAKFFSHYTTSRE
jgi:hypothetical protein